MSKLAHSNDETMRRIENDRMLEDDPALYRCAGCGLGSPNENKPCDCVTDCGYRPRKGNGPEVIVWKDCRGPTLFHHSKQDWARDLAVALQPAVSGYQKTDGAYGYYFDIKQAYETILNSLEWKKQ